MPAPKPGFGPEFGPAFRLAHLSDLHLPMPDRLAARDYLSKRVLSYISWRRKRQYLHRPEILARIIEDVATHAPDHVAVTGDIVNLSLPGEFDRSIGWLEKFGADQDVTVIPGNHDWLVPLADGTGPARWARWMTDDGASATFPFVRIRKGVALIGVNTGVPTAPHLASGLIGKEQAERLRQILASLGARGLFRVVLIHHPLGNHAKSARKALTDRHLVHAVLRDEGAEIVLHGHNHRPEFYGVEGPAGNIPVIGVSSASQIPKRETYAARWHLLEITKDNGAWRTDVTARRYTGDGAMETCGRFSLQVPTASNAS